MQALRCTRGYRGKRAWLAFAVMWTLTAAFTEPRPANAQTVPHGLLEPGNAVVAGFSGAIPPIQIAPGVEPASLTFIDLNGASLRVIDLQNMAGPPAAQLVAAPKPFTITAAQIGQVFAVAL